MGPPLTIAQAGIVSALLLLLGAICLCSRRARTRLLPQALFTQSRSPRASATQYDAQNPFSFGTMTTSVIGPASMQQMRSPTPPRSLHEGARPLMRRASTSETTTTIDDRSSVFSGLRQHPVSLIADSDASFAPPPTPMVGRDSLRPYPATRGFAAARDSSRASGQTWASTQPPASSRQQSDQFEFEPPPPPLSHPRWRTSDMSSAPDSLYRASHATPASYIAGLSPPPPHLGMESYPSPPAVGQHAFMAQQYDQYPEVPGGMVYYASSSAAGFRASRVVEPDDSFAQATRVSQQGDAVNEGASKASSRRQGPGSSSSGESLVEVTTMQRSLAPLQSPDGTASHFSRATSSETGDGTSGTSSRHDGASGAFGTTGFGASASSGRPED